MAKDTVVLMGVGEIGATDGPMEPYSALVRPTLATADVRFVQCERLYSERGTLQLGSGVNPSNESKRAHPKQASVYKDCGFDVVSVANNHGGEFGLESLLDTIEVMKKLGAQPIGAGRNIREARQPAIIERNGVKIAFLAYLSVMRPGYEATHTRGGMVPLRAHTYYEPIDYNPGMLPRTRSYPYPEDLEAMVEDIKAAKAIADVVVMSAHWGIHLYEKVIAEYQTIIAREAIDAGVDLILGHHPHIAKAIEVYKGKVCFYSLANFIVNHPRTPEVCRQKEKHYGIKMDPEYPLQAFGMGSHRTLIAKAVISKEGIQKVSYLPMMQNKQCQPEVLHRGDPRFDDVVNYMEWLSDGFRPQAEGFGAKFTVEGDEVVINGSH